MPGLTEPVTADIPWFAGVIDARAHFELTNRRGVPQPRLRITTNRIDLLQVLCEMTGTTLHINDKDYHRRLCTDHCDEQHIHVVSQSSFWNVDCTRATIVLYSCLPFLHAHKTKARALLDAGYPTYQPTKNGTAGVMKRLGWNLPVKG